ncbi:MmcQ/YjbR family DNA-binding protein [Thermoactinospora rubra]|uniref:MmcQ/YjbR family DNA-binding protein n=1 Tax=Thermoactinospora rubra TaxID=1088767 RepID=UPI000A10A432|nr:MmcQ/YjbR family DNA-binding protein [Thermoactinospora rubra]
MDMRERLREFALGLPEAWEDSPWEGDRVVKAGKKIFLFLGADEPDPRWTPSFSVKLTSEAHGHALTVEGAAPTGYGLGRAGWVTVPFTSELPDFEVLADWVEESYRNVAPKRAVKQLDERG